MWYLAICVSGYGIYLPQSNRKRNILARKYNLVQPIILQHWFLVNLSFQLLESKDKNEEEDNSSIELVIDVKHKGSIPSPQGKRNDLDNPP